MDIENFAEVIESQIKPLSVLRYNCQRLLGIGENYGSVLFKVEVVAKTEKGEEQILNLVAKTPPPKGFIWELFTTTVTFKKEVLYYEKVVPTLETFLEDLNLLHLLTSAPKYYGSRMTLRPNSDTIDENALLLLENLKTEGYTEGDRFTGFDLQTSKLIIDNIAKNHAIAIAFREALPHTFTQELLPIVDMRYKIDLTKNYASEMTKSYIDFLKLFGKDFTSYHDKIVDNFLSRVSKYNKPVDSNIFNTIIHNDLWTNNILVKMENSRISDVKFVDFQVIGYQPAINDLIFFLYTSVQLPVLQKYTDYLIEYYYDRFVSVLSITHTDSTKFTRAKFEKTIIPECRSQFAHIIKLLCPIFTKKGKAKELADFSPTDFKPSLENVHENFAPRLEYIISEFIRRDWL